MNAPRTDDGLEAIRDRLLGRAYLYDDAQAYRAGVEAALRSVALEHNPVIPAGTPLEGIAVGQ